MDLRTTVEHMFAPARHPGLVRVELELSPPPRPRVEVLVADAAVVAAALASGGVA